MGPQREQPSCLGIIGPVFSHSVRLVMAPNFLSHLIKIVLGITYHFPPPPHNLLFTHWSDFLPLTLLFNFIYCMSSEWCHLSFLQQPFQPSWPNQIFPLPQNIILQLSLPRWLPFAARPHPPRCLFHLDSPFLVRHVSLLSPVGCHAFCHSIWKVLHSKSLYFVPVSSCSVLHTLDTQYMFDDCELAVCRLPTIFNRVS